MLVIVRHRGELDVTKLPKWLASRQVGMDSGEYETLVDARLEDVSVLEGMAWIIEVLRASPGVFYGDDGTVTIHEDGSWSVPDMEEE